jgi:hypothetical protein
MKQIYAISIIIITSLSIALAAPSPKKGGGPKKSVGGAVKGKTTKQMAMVPERTLIKLEGNDGKHI